MSDTMQSLDQLSALKPATPEAPKYVKKVDKQGRAYATGKRKDAVARVWIKPGAGKVIVNTREVEVYFARPVLRMMIQQPLVAAARAGQYDVICTVAGGGLSGQARAGSARRLEEGRLPDPRLPRGRAQEVRPRQGPQVVPVLEALIASNLQRMLQDRERAPSGALFCCAFAEQLTLFFLKTFICARTNFQDRRSYRPGW